MANVEVTAKENGPYLIAGQATYVDADGNEQTTQGTMVALCRCGQSANKPFCDGAHRTADFKGEEIALTVSE